MLCKIHWINDEEASRKISFGINGLKIINFLMWFFIAVGDGSKLSNTNFNLGYNCRLIDWTVLSGTLLIVASMQGFVAFQIFDRMNWELQQTETKADEKKVASIQEQRLDMILLVSASLTGGFIMFVWDYLAFTIS